MNEEEISRDLLYLQKEVAQIKEVQNKYIEEQHKMELGLIKMQSDLSYIKKSQDDLNGNISKLLFIIGGGFIAAFVTWVVKGGLNL